MDRIESAEWWLQYASEELAENPTSTLYHFAFHKWDMVEDLFQKPVEVREAILRSQIREILLAAFANTVIDAERKMIEDRVKPPCTTWNSMEISIAFSLAELIAVFDPLRAVQAKLQLDHLSRRLGESLYSIANTPYGIFLVPDEGIKW